MKTNRIKLLAIGLSVVAITATATIPAQAQRRESQSRTEAEKKDDRQIKKTVERKSTFREYDTPRRGSEGTTVRSQPRATQKSAETPKRDEFRNNTPAQRQAAPAVREAQRRNPQTNATTREREQPSVNNGARNRTNTERGRSDVERRPESRESFRQPRATAPVQRNNEYRERGRSSSANATERIRPRSSFRDSREMYRLDRDDQRYSVTRNYKGRNDTWSANYRNNYRHYSHFDKKYYKNYNYHNHVHWHHDWSDYRWNVSSWIDYYQGYHPYSYTFHRHYYHHPVYGHVIRKFRHRPDVFVINHRNFYVYDGHFFRFMPRIGYVLVDIPFGVTFDYIPARYERVFINGYPYVRVGNLFFEFTDFGYRLVHYPERYFAYMDDFHHDGYYFDDVYYD